MFKHWGFRGEKLEELGGWMTTDLEEPLAKFCTKMFLRLNWGQRLNQLAVDRENMLRQMR